MRFRIAACNFEPLYDGISDPTQNDNRGKFTFKSCRNILKAIADTIRFRARALCSTYPTYVLLFIKDKRYYNESILSLRFDIIMWSIDLRIIILGF